MVPSLPYDPLVIAPDPKNTTGVYYAACTACNGQGFIVVSNTCDSTSNYDFRDFMPKTNARLTGMFAKYLSDAEKALLRELNWEPTKEGVKICQTWHDRSRRWIASLPQLHARFDRRIPCWRAGRWKSLT